MRWGWVIAGLVIWWIVVQPAAAASTVHAVVHGITAFFSAIG